MPTTTRPLDVVDLSDDHVHLSVERLPRSPIRLGCRVCGGTVREHGLTTLHRFVRPDLPDGYRYLDSVRVGEVVTLLRERHEGATLEIAQLDRALVPNDDDLLWLVTREGDCYLLHPATIVADARTA